MKTIDTWSTNEKDGIVKLQDVADNDCVKSLKLN